MMTNNFPRAHTGDSVNSNGPAALTKLLQCCCLHLCRKIFCLQKTFIRFFRCSVFLLRAEGEERDTEVVKARRRVSLVYGSLWTDTKSLKTPLALVMPTHIHAHTQGRVIVEDRADSICLAVSSVSRSVRASTAAQAL